MDKRFETIEERLDKMDKKFVTIEKRIDELDKRLTKELRELSEQIGKLQKNNEVLITHSLNVINKIFEGILNISSAKNADYNHLGKKNQDNTLDISSITEEA